MTNSTTAILVCWNGRRYLHRCLLALKEQLAPDSIVVVDNASSDGSADFVRASHPDVRLVANRTNRGYAGGANEGLKEAGTEFALIINPDVALAPDYVSRLEARMRSDERIGIAQGRLHCVDPDDFVAGIFEDRAPIDSAGHRISRTRMVYDIGQGETDTARHLEERSVFSASGAALFLRRSTLEDIAVDGEYFDESFFAYKEDIDLCWRARLLGWDVRYLPDAVGWHVRSWRGTGGSSIRKLPPAVRFHSFKNHYLLMLKNDRILDLARDILPIVGWELLRQVHLLLRDRHLFRVYPELLRLLPSTLRKRRNVMRRRRVSTSVLRRWLS